MAFHPDITRRDDVSVALDAANAAVRLASRQMTGNAGSVTIPNADGTKTVMGVDAGDAGVAPWVGDTTAPGTPTGVSAQSGSGMIVVSWDGTLDGGVPPDFHHVALLVDGVESGRLAAKGSVVFGPYDSGATHLVSAVAYDDAHGEDGSSRPNASAPSDSITVKVAGSDIDPDRLGIAITKAITDPSGDGVNKGDLWLKYDRDPDSSGAALVGEWWWNESAWVEIPVSIYLDQLASRGVNADSAVIGLLSAGIITSGLFRTAESGARVVVDSMGIRAYDSDNVLTFNVSAQTGEVMASGRFYSGKPGGRVIIDPAYDDVTSPDEMSRDSIVTLETRSSHYAPFIAGIHDDDVSGLQLVSGTKNSASTAFAEQTLTAGDKIAGIDISSYDNINDIAHNASSLIVQSSGDARSKQLACAIIQSSDRNGALSYGRVQGADHLFYVNSDQVFINGFDIGTYHPWTALTPVSSKYSADGFDHFPVVSVMRKGNDVWMYGFINSGTVTFSTWEAAYRLPEWALPNSQQRMVGQYNGQKWQVGRYNCSLDTLYHVSDFAGTGSATGDVVNAHWTVDSPRVQSNPYSTFQYRSPGRLMTPSSTSDGMFGNWYCYQSMRNFDGSYRQFISDTGRFDVYWQGVPSNDRGMTLAADMNIGFTTSPVTADGQSASPVLSKAGSAYTHKSGDAGFMAIDTFGSDEWNSARINPVALSPGVGYYACVMMRVQSPGSAGSKMRVNNVSAQIGPAA